jgi:hypothetical protein
MKVVRTTVAQVEESADRGPDDQAVAELKHKLLRRIVDIDIDDGDLTVSADVPLMVDGPHG